MVVPAGNLDLSVVIRIFDENVLTQDGLRVKLVKSLVKAKCIAKQKLTGETYEYFDAVYGDSGWPTTVEAYLDYVSKYLTQVPFATKEKWHWILQRVLKLPEKYGQLKHLGVYDTYQECVYNELCHFYWLVNQKLDDEGNTLQQNELFASWLKIFGMGQGVFLNTPDSLTKESLKTFEEDPLFNFSWYCQNKDEWKCFNDFFSRQFNDADPITGLSPLRPIDPDQFVITSPADCTFRAMYNIDENGMLMDPDGNSASYTLKGFSPGCSVQDLLTDQCCPFWENFYGGTFIHYFLSPYDYHRFHAPVAGLVVAVETITGQNYLDTVIDDTGGFDAPDNAENGYEFRQERGLIIVDNEDIGKVATLPIGMAQVSGVHMYTDKLLYRNVVKGQEFGYFLFGGSDIIMLIPKPVHELSIIKGTEKNPKVFQYGHAAVVCKEK